MQRRWIAINSHLTEYTQFFSLVVYSREGMFVIQGELSALLVFLSFMRLSIVLYVHTSSYLLFI